MTLESCAHALSKARHFYGRRAIGIGRLNYRIDPSGFCLVYKHHGFYVVNGTRDFESGLGEMA